LTIEEIEAMPIVNTTAGTLRYEDVALAATLKAVRVILDAYKYRAQNPAAFANKLEIILKELEV